jgi:hypothetical protein
MVSVLTSNVLMNDVLKKSKEAKFYMFLIIYFSTINIFCKPYLALFISSFYAMLLT